VSALGAAAGPLTLEHGTPEPDVLAAAEGDPAGAAAAGGRVRRLGPADADLVASLLCRFVPRVSAAAWRRSLVDIWPQQPDTIGLGLYADDRLVGFLGTIFAARQIDGRRRIVCNMHSMYVDPRYASTSAYLLFKLRNDPEITLTVLTPSARVDRILRSAGFRPLETSYRLYVPLMNLPTLLRRPARIVRASGLEPWLDTSDAALLRDHVALGCNGYAILHAGGYALVVTRRSPIRKLRWAHVSDVLYVRDAAVLARCFEQAKLAILRGDRTQVLRVDDRLMGGWTGYGIRRSRHSLFHSRDLDATQIDNLYSEALFQDTLILVPPSRRPVQNGTRP
jgi:hypothetical protein